MQLWAFTIDSHLSPTQRAFGAWLCKNQVRRREAERHVCRGDGVAFCYGWIDGQKKALDAQFWLQRFTPRRPRSIWSKTNRAKAEALIASGRMQPNGPAEVERARADVRWEAAYDGSRTAVVPPDLEAAFVGDPKRATSLPD